MKLSKEATKLLEKILREGGEIIMSDYSSDYPAMLELIKLGLVERIESWKAPMLEEDEQEYEATASHIFETEDDVESHVEIRDYLARKKQKCRN